MGVSVLFRPFISVLVSYGVCVCWLGIWWYFTGVFVCVFKRNRLGVGFFPRVRFPEGQWRVQYILLVLVAYLVVYLYFSSIFIYFFYVPLEGGYAGGSYLL